MTSRHRAPHGQRHFAQLDPRYLLFHDSYHVDQIMYPRAMLGTDALES